MARKYDLISELYNRTCKRLCQILRTGRHSWLRLAEIISYVMTNSFLYMHSDLMQQRFLR